MPNSSCWCSQHAILHEFKTHLHTHQKSFETNSDMLQLAVRRLLLDIFDVALICVREFVVRPPTSRKSHEFNFGHCAAISSWVCRTHVFLFLVRTSAGIVALSTTRNASRYGINVIHDTCMNLDDDVHASQSKTVNIRKKDKRTLGIGSQFPLKKMLHRNVAHQNGALICWKFGRGLDRPFNRIGNLTLVEQPFGPSTVAILAQERFPVRTCTVLFPLTNVSGFVLVQVSAIIFLSLQLSYPFSWSLIARVKM